MTTDEIISEFIRDTIKWHKACFRTDESCAICGAVPDNLLAVAKALESKDKQMADALEKKNVNQNNPLTL